MRVKDITSAPAEFVAWYRSQERMPTVSDITKHLGCSRSTAHKIVTALGPDGAGLIEVRTLEDRWAR